MRLLVVVDMQNDFVTGTLGFPEANEIVQPIEEKIKEYLKEDQWVIFTQDTHSENTYTRRREGRHLPTLHCIKDTSGWEILRTYKPYIKSCGTLEKEDSFGFTHSEIEDVNMPTANHWVDFDEIDEVEIVGLVTNLCVLSCAVTFQNMLPDAEVIIDASCCRSFNKELHKKALDVMEGLQMKIINR